MKLLAVVVGPTRKVKIHNLPVGGDAEAITYALLFWNECEAHYEYKFVKELPVGVHLQDYPNLTLKQLAELDKALEDVDWETFTKQGPRTKIRLHNVGRETIKKGGDLKYRMSKPVDSFASKAEHERIYGDE